MQPNPSSCLAATAFSALLAYTPLADAATLGEALSAYRNNRVAEAEAMFGEIAADPIASLEDRAAAWRELARIDWLIRGETDGAEAALVQVALGQGRCATLLMALRVFREAGAPQRGIAEAEQGSGECTPSAGEELRVELARAHLEHARRYPDAGPRHLAAAAAELAAIEPVARRTPAVASANLLLALSQRDADAALQAWRDYFWLNDTDTPQALSAFDGRVAEIFRSGLAENAGEASRMAIVDLLIRAGFSEYARQLADNVSDAQGWRNARAYFAFYDAVRAQTLRANREMAAGGRAEWYRDGIMGALQELMRGAGLSIEPSDDPRIALYRTMTALAEAYGLFGTVGQTGGYPSLHAGHLAQDERLAVAQYGRSSELRFIVIDNMLANGFESWLWDGWAQAGGWAGGGIIVQVRSAYTDGPLNALRRARPGPSRDAYVDEIERNAGPERVALGRDGVAELPATSRRLTLQAIDQIAAQTADDAAFVATHWSETVHYSITLHEGRHALDQAAGDFTSAELEFRAKLSQIALSDYPRLGLANVAGQTLGDTPHGAANRRILEGYRNWMRRHRREIAGFDRNQPALSQLHLLTDQQIIHIARSMDPWAR